MAKQTFTTGQVLTAAQMTSLQQTAMGGGSTTAKTASYTLVAADAGTVVQMNSASATTITVNTALFSAGDTVQIQNIGAGVCTVTAGTATVSTAGSLALSQWEGGQLYFNSTSAAIFFDLVQSAAAGGKVLQVVQGTTSTAVTNSTTTYADTTLTATITPTLATSKVLVMVSQNGCNKTAGNAGNGLKLKLVRDATDILQIAQAALYSGVVSDTFDSVSSNYLDSPSTTSATTYKTQFANYNAATQVEVQRVLVAAVTSTIILLEIGA
jgi:hypothetical protein